MQITRRHFIQVAGASAVLPLVQERLEADHCCRPLWPRCPVGFVYLELCGFCLVAGHRNYSPGRRYLVHAKYIRHGNQYDIEVPCLGYALRNQQAESPACPGRGLRVVQLCWWLKSTEGGESHIAKMAIPYYGYDVVRRCRFDHLMALRTMEGTRAAYCTVRCKNGDEHIIPDTEGSCAECPNEGCKECPDQGPGVPPPPSPEPERRPTGP